MTNIMTEDKGEIRVSVCEFLIYVINGFNCVFWSNCVLDQKWSQLSMLNFQSLISVDPFEHCVS